MPDSDISDQNESIKGKTVATDRYINGLLATYTDDQLNDCITSALSGKSRVRYRCMDVQLDHMAFGTSGGAIYLFKLGSFNHSPCSLESMIPCDQGSVEVLKFLPNVENDDLLIVIGTSRGSLVIFRLTRVPSDQSPFCNEVYRAVNFTDNVPIKLIEFDQNYLMDPQYSLDRIYICDRSNRIYALDQRSFSVGKQTTWGFHAKQQPTLILGVNYSKVNQLSIFKSLLLISTDENSKIYYEQTCRLHTIGTKKRKKGFFGACFFTPRQKLNARSSNQSNPHLSSVGSVYEPEHLIIFVARPMFRLWQVNHERAVMFTHQFEPMMKLRRLDEIELKNKTINDLSEDEPDPLIESFDLSRSRVFDSPQADHFHKLITISTLTLGNLLLSYSQHEIFVIDPVSAELILWTPQADPIVQIACFENELFVWTQATDDNPGRGLKIKRLVLFAPTQLVLELHRTQRYLSLIMFVQMFLRQFRELMALPLRSSSIITTEGGLLRNILLNAWDSCQASRARPELALVIDSQCGSFKALVDEILDESRQLKESFDNIADSTLFLNMTNENIERLCSEPYASLVSLQVSIADLHTNHVIHFDQDTINRHKSIANLSKDIMSLQENKQQMTRSNLTLSGNSIDGSQLNISNGLQQPRRRPKRPEDAKVIVERQKPNKQRAAALGELDPVRTPNRPFFSPREASVRELDPSLREPDESLNGDVRKPDVAELTTGLSHFGYQNPMFRCSRCRWPRDRIHCHSLSSGQNIQMRWIEDNLCGNFKENLDQIESRAFEHGLWHLFLRCLLERNQLDDYIKCCIMLDDIRLLNLDEFLWKSRSEAELSENLLATFEHKLELEIRLNAQQSSDGPKSLCLKCEDLFGLLDEDTGTQHRAIELEDPLQVDDDFSFNLINLLEQVLIKRNGDVKRVINALLRHPKLVDGSKIPAGFYLRAIATATAILIAKQYTFSRARLEQLRGAGEFALASEF